MMIHHVFLSTNDGGGTIVLTRSTPQQGGGAAKCHLLALACLEKIGRFSTVRYSYM